MQLRASFREFIIEPPDVCLGLWQGKERTAPRIESADEGLVPLQSAGDDREIVPGGKNQHDGQHNNEERQKLHSILA